MASEGAKKGWGELTRDEQDLFTSPHTKMASDEFRTSGFGLRDKALAVIDNLNDEGKRKALSEIDQVVASLRSASDARRTERPNLSPIPHGDIETVRKRLRSDLGIQ